MTITVHGYRASPTDWDAAHKVPREQLPALTPEQRQVAGQLRIPEEVYARSAWAADMGARKLLAKTERFARLLQRKVAELNPAATIENVALNTWDDRFEIDMKVNGTACPLRVAEGLVDELFEAGSAEAEQRLSRILAMVFETRGR